MSKVLWYGDACSNTGFARVTHSILDILKETHEIVVLGINYTGDPHDHPYKVYPACPSGSNDRFGIGRIPEIIDKEKPDVVICLNDIWVVNQFWERCQFLKDQVGFKFIAYFPVDSESYFPDMLRHIKHWDLAVTFTVPSAERVMKYGADADRMAVLPHGVDTGRFYPIDRAEARKTLGLPEDKFIVLNANRNQPRKRIDLAIKAFAEFAVDKPDTLLYLHMSSKDLGWDILPLFKHEMRRRNLDDANRLVLTATDINYLNAPSDQLLNAVYNACDIGLNTSDGEGWGLVSFEHASCKKPQLVPNHTACKDIWKDAAELIPISTWVVDKDLGVERGLIDVQAAARLMSDLYYDEHTYMDAAEACYNVTQRPEYRWESVAAGFSAAIKDLGV